MKIFILDKIIFPDGTGHSTHKFELVKNLSKLGCDVHVLTPDNSIISGIYSYHLNFGKKNKMNRFNHKLLYLLNIKKIISSNDFDIIYTRNTVIGIIGLFLKKKRSKFVFEINGLFSEDKKFERLKNNLTFFKNLKFSILAHFDILVAKKADAVITVAEGYKRYLVNRMVSKEKIIVIPNGADVNTFKPMSNLDTFYESLNISKSNKVVLHVGNIAPYHGIEYIIKSAKIILKKFPDTKFLIVGKGDDIPRLIDLAERIGVSNAFVFTGYVPYELVPKYINISTVCVAPTNRGKYTSPIKIYEYLSCGKPVVASDLNNIGDLLRKSQSGIAIIPEDEDKLAEAIIKLLDDEQIRTFLGKNGREYVIKHCSWEQVANKTIDVFNIIIGR